MSLTTDDLKGIRLLIREEVQSIVSHELHPIKAQLMSLEGKIEALESGVKEIYVMIAGLQKRRVGDKGFRKLSLQDRLLVLNNEYSITNC